MAYPLGLNFEMKPRRNGLTTYTITSHMFAQSDTTSLYMYSTGAISIVGGAACFRINREQANYILRQARDNGSTIRKRITE